MATIRAATERDIDGIVSMHMRAFEGFFLASMGKRFLAELYRNFTLDTEGICLVAEEDKNLLGFVAGALDAEVFFRGVRRRRWHAFMFASLGAILRRPFRLGRKLMSALSYEGDRPSTHMEAALLSSVAVDPDHSGKGIGRLLIDAFCGKVRDAGIDLVYLTTDRDDNERINRLYREYGFKLEGEFCQPGGRFMNRYLLDLRGQDTTEKRFHETGNGL